MLFFVVCVCFALFPAQVLWGAQNGLALCINAVIPSLLPFIFISSCIIKSGFSKPLGIVFSKILTPLTKISPIGCVCFVTGILGGYGAGAKAVCESFKQGQISKEEAQRLLPVCNNAGPLFIIGTIGINFFSDKTVGVILFMIQILTALLCASFFGGSAKKQSEKLCDSIKTYKKNKPSLGKLVTEAAGDCANAIAAVCVFVITFSALTEIIPFGKYSFLSGIIEITKASAQLSREGYAALPMISAFIAWGGLSVHFQANAITEGCFSMKNYYVVKLISAMISYAIAKICLGDMNVLLLVCSVTVATMAFWGIIRNLFSPEPSRQHGFRQQRHS